VRFSKENLATIASKIMSQVANARIHMKCRVSDETITVTLDVVDLTITYCKFMSSRNPSLTIEGTKCLNMLADVVCSECEVEIKELIPHTESEVKFPLELCKEFKDVSDYLRLNKEVIKYLLKPTIHLGGTAGLLSDILTKIIEGVGVGAYLLYIRSSKGSYYILLLDGKALATFKYVKGLGFSDIGPNSLNELLRLNEVVSVALYKVNQLRVPKDIRDKVFRCS